jgi:hypothetical protein
VVWANAHITQFTEIGWKYLAVGHGSGELPRGADDWKRFFFVPFYAKKRSFAKTGSGQTLA